MAERLTAELERRFTAGDSRALARAASLVESRTVVGRELIISLFPRTGRAMLVGITGAPGAGKSTLVNEITAAVRRQGQTIGIIAVDPSSPFTQGALLGDRIRLQQHHGDSGVFIRSMATRGKLGGLAQSTLDIALLFDAFGFDLVLIETVGVGQDEIDVAKLADVTVLVLAPGLGDDVQAMKAGIMEIADLFAINKSDLPGADRLEQDIRGMQSISHSIDPAGRLAPIHRVVASTGAGVDELLAEIRSIHAGGGRRHSQAGTWVIRLRELLRETLLETLPQAELERHAALVATKQEDPYSAIKKLRQLIA